MFHYCAHCEYKSQHKWVLRRHINAKHKNHSEMSQAQNQYYGPYSRAPTTISVCQDRGCHQSRKNNIEKEQVHQEPIQTQPTDCDLMEDSIHVFKIYKLLQRMKNK